jgi:hypothetical protein
MIGLNGGLIGKRRDPLAGLGSVSLQENAIKEGSDIYWSDVAAYLPLTGANNGTTFNDLSNNAYTVTGVGGPVTSTARWPFAGSGSTALFDGVDDYLEIGTAADWKFIHDASTNWTAEGWIYLTNVSLQSRVLLGTSVASAQVGFFIYCYGRDFGCYINRGQSGVQFGALTTSGTAVTVNTWHHWCVKMEVLKEGATTFARLQGYIDGTSVFTASTSSFAFSTSNPTNAGRISFPSFLITGNASTVRVTKNALRYGSSFTPSPKPFSAR